MADRRAGPHVAMLVRNPYTHDSRVEKEARSLSGAGYAVTVVADARPGLPESGRGPAGETVRRVARRGPPIPGVRYLVHEARLARALIGLRPDVLHAHDTNALIPVAFAAARLRVPFVYDAHELWLGRPRRGRGRVADWLHRAWYSLVESLVVRRAAAVMTVSEPIARHLQRAYALRRVVLVPNYPEPEDATVAARDLRELPDADHLDDRPIVLYVGGVMAERGLEELLDATALVPDVQLVLLGDGELGGALSQRAVRLGISARFHLLRPVPSGQVVAYAGSADVGISSTPPSGLNNRYSLPNKVFQYMAAAVPVIASDFPQVRDVVEGAGAGVVVDTTRPEAIAAAIRSILADRGEARAMGARGRVAVAERLNWSAAERSLLDVYRDVLNGVSARSRAR